MMMTKKSPFIVSAVAATLWIGAGSAIAEANEPIIKDLSDTNQAVMLSVLGSWDEGTNEFEASAISISIASSSSDHGGAAAIGFGNENSVGTAAGAWSNAQQSLPFAGDPYSTNITCVGNALCDNE